MYKYTILMKLLMKISEAEAIKLPENLENLPKADEFPAKRGRWNTNEVRNQFFIIVIKYNP